MPWPRRIGRDALARIFDEDAKVAVCTGRVEALVSEPRASCCLKRTEGFARGNRRIRLPDDAGRLLHGGRAPLIAWAISVGCGCSYAVRRDVALDLGGFDEALDLGAPLAGGGDHDLLWRALEAGWRVVYQPARWPGTSTGATWPRSTSRSSATSGRCSLFWASMWPGPRQKGTAAAGLHRLETSQARCSNRPPRLGPRSAADFCSPPHVVELLDGPGRLPRCAARWPGLGGSGTRHEHSRPGSRVAGSADTPSRLSQVWSHRELLHSMIIRNLKVKYQRSLLGFVWTLINPLLTVAILVLIFSHVVRIPLPHYWAFVLSGYFVWNCTLQTLNTGTYIFAEHSRLTRSVAFPSEILVFSAAGSRVLEFLAEIVLIWSCWPCSTIPAYRPALRCCRSCC